MPPFVQSAWDSFYRPSHWIRSAASQKALPLLLNAVKVEDHWRTCVQTAQLPKGRKELENPPSGNRSVLIPDTLRKIPSSLQFFYPAPYIFHGLLQRVPGKKLAFPWFPYTPIALSMQCTLLSHKNQDISHEARGSLSFRASRSAPPENAYSQAWGAPCIPLQSRKGPSYSLKAFFESVLNLPA